MSLPLVQIAIDLKTEQIKTVERSIVFFAMVLIEELINGDEIGHDTLGIWD